MNTLPGIKIAIQRRGKLSEPSKDYLNSLGLQFKRESEDELATRCTNADVTIFWLRDDDIPQLVGAGVVDFGIVGENILLEKNIDTPVVQKLCFGKCRLVIAVPKNAGITRLADLTRKRIATTYPFILQRYLKAQRIVADIILVSGSAEIAPLLDMAEAVCDLTQSGKTLKKNNLTVLEIILESQAVLISSPVIGALQSQFLNLCKSSLPIKTL